MARTAVGAVKPRRPGRPFLARLRGWRPSRRQVYAALGAVALVGLAALLPKGLRTLGFFQVRRVEVSGARYLTAAEVARRLRLRPGASVFDDLEPLGRRVLGMNGVIEARVTRRLPGTLRVEIREREAVALTPRGGRLVLMDVTGRALPFDPTRPVQDLPLADADSLVGRLLVRLRDAEPELYARVDAGRRLRPADVVLETGPRRWIVRADATAEDLRAVAIVLGELDRRGRSGWRELDARLSGRVIVRRRTGA